MNKITIILALVSIGCIFTLSSISDSEAKLWDFVVDVGIQNNSTEEIKNMSVIGTVVDHAYKPLSDIDVKVTFAGESHMLKTDELGEFRKQFDSSNFEPRTYSVQVYAASDDGKQGMARTSFHIDGHTQKSAKFERQLESMEMANDPSKLRKNSNDPISVILYQHYLQLQEKIVKAQYEEQLLNEYQNEIKAIKQISFEKLMDTLDEHTLVFTEIDKSPKMQRFLGSLDTEKKEIFGLQLNFTKMRVAEAQHAMQYVLNNGGSLADARQAYLDHASITQEELNSYTIKPEKTVESIQPPTNSTKN